MAACPECGGRAGVSSRGAVCQTCGRGGADGLGEPAWVGGRGDDTLVDIGRDVAHIVEVDEVGASADVHAIEVEDASSDVHLIDDASSAGEPYFEPSSPDVEDALEPFPPLPRSAESTPVVAPASLVPPRPLLGGFTTTPTETITRVLGERELLHARVASGLEPPAARPTPAPRAARTDAPEPRPLFGAETPLPRAVRVAPPDLARDADPELRDARPERTLPRTVPLWVWGAAALLALVVGVTAGWVGSSSRGAPRGSEITTPATAPTSSSRPAPRARSSRSSK